VQSIGTGPLARRLVTMATPSLSRSGARGDGAVTSFTAGIERADRPCYNSRV